MKSISFELVFFSSSGKWANIAGSILNFEESPYCFPQWLHRFIFPPTAHEVSLLFASSTTLFLSCLYANSHSNRCGAGLLQCWFAFLWRLVMLSTLSCSCWPSVPSFRTSIQVLCPFLNRICFWYWVVWVLCTYWILAPYQIHVL